MKTKHPESFGSDKYYHNVIVLVTSSNNLWRKVANLLSNLRRDMREWPHIDRENQAKEAKKYVVKALKDTKLPSEVSSALKEGIHSEFGFELTN